MLHYLTVTIGLYLFYIYDFLITAFDKISKFILK